MIIMGLSCNKNEIKSIEFNLNKHKNHIRVLCKKWEFDFYEIVLVSISLWLLIDRGSLPRRRRVIGKWRMIIGTCGTYGELCWKRTRSWHARISLLSRFFSSRSPMMPRSSGCINYKSLRRYKKNFVH